MFHGVSVVKGKVESGSPREARAGLLISNYSVIIMVRMEIVKEF